MAKKQQNIDFKTLYANETIKWCRKNLGINERKRKKLDFVVMDKSRKKGRFNFLGNYCFYRNRMVIYAPNCENIYEIVSTVIHEYTHYLQSGPQYRKYEKNYYYSTNPYEREAKRNEMKYTKMCLKDIKKKLR
jgi:hypothetical protein